MWWIFKRKREIERLKNEIRGSFDNVKKDFEKVGQWITHIDGKYKEHDEEISEIKEAIFNLQEGLDELKESIYLIKPELFKHKQTTVHKQTAVQTVQTAVQTAVQTGDLSGLTLMERAIVWALVNSEMSLSYEDLAVILGKNKSTIRGQVNNIKQKYNGLIAEKRELNGKKRLYIPGEVKEKILKSVKVRVKSSKKGKKSKKK